MLIFQRPATRQAFDLLKKLEAPLMINYLHQLQIENLILQAQANVESRNRGLQAAKLWRQHLLEQVLTIESADWETAFRLAISWNSKRTGAAPLLLLHAGLAAASGATDFFSFDPPSRSVARATGMKLHPAEL